MASSNQHRPNGIRNTGNDAHEAAVYTGVSIAARSAALAALPNLGPASAQMLLDAGIGSPQQLQQLGAVAAYWQVKQQRKACGQGCSLNLLWALAGALENCHWTQIKREQGADLLLAIDALDALQ